MIAVDCEPAGKYRAYGARWGVLLLFSVSNLVNAAMWVTFAPVQEQASLFYDVGASGINMLAIMFMLMYLPGTLLAAHVMNRVGLAKAVGLANGLTLLGCAVRMVGCIPSISPHAAYAAAMGGQCLVAIAQPFFTNTPAKLAEQWFPDSQRDVATTVAALFSPLGNAAGQVAPSVLVQRASDIPKLLAWEAGVAALVCALSFLFRSAPPTPPSRAAERRATLRAEAAAQAGGSQSVAHLWHDMLALLRHREFAKLTLGFGLGMGVFNAFMTLVAQLVRPYGYGSDDAGIFGGVVIVAGLVGSAVVAPIMDARHAYRPALKCGILACVASFLLYMLALRPGQHGVAIVLFAVMGACLLPMLPIALANAVECTYPIPEEASSGVMLLWGQVTGVAAILVLTPMLEHAGTYCTPFTAHHLLLAALLVAAGIPIMAFKGRYLRLGAEQQGQQDALLVTVTPSP